MYPQFLTHYYNEEPFRSIMDLSPAEQVRAVKRLRSARRVHRRLMIPNYYATRRRYEAIMRRQFIDKGGSPTREHPIYLVLGESDLWTPQASRTLRIPLSAIDSSHISFTHTDSWYVYADKDLNGRAIVCQPHLATVFRREELDALFAEYGWPSGRWKRGHEQPPFKHDYYVEAQVWADEPLRSFVRGEVRTGDNEKRHTQTLLR